MQQFGKCHESVALSFESRDDPWQGFNSFAPIRSMGEIQSVVEQNDIPGLRISYDTLGYLGTGDAIPIAGIFRPPHRGESVFCSGPEKPGGAESPRWPEKSAVGSRHLLQNSFRRFNLPFFLT
jgi:hypothetical protein